MTTAYLIVYGADPSDRLAAYKFTSRAAAHAASLTDLVPRVPPGAAAGGCAYVVENPADVTFGGALLLAVYNGLSGKPPVGRFADRAAGVKRLMCLLETAAQDGPEPQQTEEKKTVAKSESNGDATRGRATKYKPTDTIKVLVDANPRREGSKANARFALYRDGMTVEEFLAAGGPMPGLIFDVNHNWIAVEA